MACSIPANPDVAGIGIRISFFVQAALGVTGPWIIRYLPLLFGRRRRPQRNIAEELGRTLLALSLSALALLISGLISRVLGQLTYYHGLLVFQLTLLNYLSVMLTASSGCLLSIWDRSEWEPYADEFADPPPSPRLRKNGVFGAAWRAVLLSYVQILVAISLFLALGMHDNDPQSAVVIGILWLGLRDPSSTGVIFVVVWWGLFFLLLVLGQFLLKGWFLYVWVSCVVTCLSVSILSAETTVQRNQWLVCPGEDQWTLGQTLALLLLVLPILDLLSQLRRTFSDETSSYEELEGAGGLGKDTLAIPGWSLAITPEPLKKLRVQMKARAARNPRSRRGWGRLRGVQQPADATLPLRDISYVQVERTERPSGNMELDGHRKKRVQDDSKKGNGRAKQVQNDFGKTEEDRSEQLGNEANVPAKRHVSFVLPPPEAVAGPSSRPASLMD